MSGPHTVSITSNGDHELMKVPPNKTGITVQVLGDADGGTCTLGMLNPADGSVNAVLQDDSLQVLTVGQARKFLCGGETTPYLTVAGGGGSLI